MYPQTSGAKQLLRDRGFHQLADAADNFDNAFGEDAILFDPILFKAPQTLKRLTHGFYSLSTKLRESFGENNNPVLEVAILRGLAPRAALATVPASSLFEESDLPLLPDQPEDRDVEAINLAQAVGRPLNYSGFLCVILKPTRLCNLRCSYCHDWSTDAQLVSVGLMVRLFAQALSRTSGLDVVLHGGEPLMMGPKRLKQMMWILSRLASSSHVIRVHLQTNGTLVNERWIQLLKLLSINVSVSFDGPPEIHDAARVDKNGRHTSSKVIAGMNKLREAGLLSGTLLVVTSKVLKLGAARLLSYLESNGIDSICLIPERPAAVGASGLSTKEFVSFLSEMYRERTLRGVRINVRELDAIERLVANKQSGFCELAGNCIGTFISVDANGDVSHCDKYHGDADYLLGNIFTETLNQILTGVRAETVRARARDIAVNESSGCAHFSRCQGWCPHERYVAQNSGELTVDCCGLAPLFDDVLAFSGEGTRL